MCNWLNAEEFLAIQQPESRADNARQMLCDLREKGVTLCLDGMKIRSQGTNRLSETERAGMSLCKQALTEALLREAERCIRCGKKHKMAWRQDYCRDCVHDLGMPLYEMMVADKRMLARMAGALRDQAILPRDKKEAQARLRLSE